MPEGPEVHTQADNLHSILAGKTIASFVIGSGWSNRKSTPKNYDTLCSALPLVVDSVWAKGKKICIDLSEEYSIISYLGMEGKWSDKKLKHSHIYLECEDGTTVWYDDSRHFGDIEVYTSHAASAARLAEIGPCLLKGGVKLEEWIDIMRQSKLDNKQIAWVFMKQDYVSGIGNYLKAEILYAARIRPNAKICELTDEMLSELYHCTMKIIQASYAAQGATLRSYLHIDGSKGDYQVVVYGKEVSLCGNRVATNYFHDDRLTHWVPDVQVLPSQYVAEEYDRNKSYLASELRNFCHIAGLKCEGTKKQLLARLG